jgi:hypothetical protein
MFTKLSPVLGCSIVALAIIAILPKSVEIKLGQSLTNPSLLETIIPQVIHSETDAAQFKTSRRGLPRRREGGGTRFV